MTTLTLAYSSSHKSIQKRSSSSVFLGINWKIICILGFIIVCSLLIFYAFLINELTGGTYMIKNYDKQIKTLSQENRNLEVDFAKTGFLGSVEQRTRDLSFEKTTSVKYIQVKTLDVLLARAK